MKITKRIISIVLLLAILVGMVPATAQAENTGVATENTETTIEGTNGFGELLSEEIQDQQEANEENVGSGYNVIGLEIENGIATVDYSSSEEAILVVSLYSEDGVKMILSGKTVVSPEETKTIIQLEGEIPEYFMAAAYLLDTYDHSPLCTAYETPMYTREMQELLASTTDDYDADKVLKLDDDTTTNFAVYADSTIILEYVEGVNMVVSADDETATYVIENADGAVTGLQPGNILAYAYGEDQVLIVKVATVTIDGATVTITGADVEIEEVFSHVKVEAMGDTADMVVDETTGDDDVTFVGMVENGPALMSLSDPYGVNAVGEEGSVSGGVSAGFEVEKSVGSNKLTASLLLDINAELSFYIAKSRRFIEFKATTESALTLEVSGKLSFDLIKLKSLGFSPIAGVYIGFEPTMSFIISAKVSASIKTTETIGFSYDSTLKGKKTKDLSTSPQTDFALDMEGTIFFGVDMAPKLKILDGWVLEASLSAEMGLELEAEMEGLAFGYNIEGDAPESIHNCEKCLKVDLYGKIEIGVSLKFLKFMTTGGKITAKSCSLGEWYRSENQGGFKKGTCPNLSYRVTVSVSDSNSRRVVGSAVTAKQEGQSNEITIGTTNNSGIVVNYLPVGKYTFTAWVSGQPVYKTTRVDGPAKVTINKEFIDNGPPTFSGSINPDSVTDYGQIIASGECGNKGKNVLWTFFSSGVLRILGQGAMMNYASSDRPWYKYCSSIKRIEVCDGVTTIGDNAFSSCGYATNVKISNSVTSIGDYAFDFCETLSSITIPDSVTTIGNYAFEYCASLTRISLPNSLTTIGVGAFYECPLLNSITIPNSVTTIGEGAFSGCYHLNSITIPNGVTTIGEGTFSGCYRLNSITIPNSVTTIGGGAFSGCTSLTEVTIPDSVTTIGEEAFRYCSSLREVTIPDSVTTIGDCAFYFCSSLTGITIPASVTSLGYQVFRFGPGSKVRVDANNPVYSSDDKGVIFSKDKTVLYMIPEGELERYTIPNGVTTIGNDVFRGYGLKSIVIPNGVTTIGDGAFASCDDLTRINIPNSVTTIGNYAFQYCLSLTSVSLPNSLTTIGNHAFSDCHSLTGITIPDSVTTIGDYAFYLCGNVKSVTIGIGVKKIGARAFQGYSPSVYYRGTRAQWENIKIDEDNPLLLNGTIHYNSSAAARSVLAMASVAVVPGDGEDSMTDEETVVQETGNNPSFYSIFDGEYETEITETYTLKKATFSGLTPGEQYVLLSLKSLEAEDVLVPENLLYIDQAAAAEDGVLIFTYAQRENTDISYVMACGPSHQDLEDAVITFPSMMAKEEIQAVHPSVEYDGKTLTEGVDYVITGAVDYTAAGEYTCYIRGIYDYTGLVECVYAVIDATASVTTEQNTVFYETIEEAMQAYSEGSVFELQKNVQADIDVSQNMLLNLNGFDIAGNVTVNDGVEFVVMDSQTDDYTVEDENGYGKITGTVSGVNAQDGYVMITEDDGTSFHRVELEVTGMLLRASVAGIYYESKFFGDELVARNVQKYGVVLSVYGIPTEVEQKNSSAYYSFEPGSAGNVADGTLLSGVMKTINTDEKNESNAAMDIFGRTYLQMKDGRVVFGRSRARSFQKQVELADQQWQRLTEVQKNTVLDMYSTYQSVMEKWDIPNIRSAA